MSGEKVDLSLVPVEDLADELIKRGSVAVVGVIDVEPKLTYWNWVGDYYSALGLCADISHTICTQRESIDE